jgi:hypothetical protein
METRVSIVSPRNRLLLVTLLGALLASASSAAAEPTKNECIAANESAQDLRQAGKLREARARLTICVAASCPGTLREDCAQRVNEIDTAMPSVVFEAKNGSGNDLGAVRVTMDGQPFAQRLDGTAIPADPGEHRFYFEADGLPRTEKTLVFREGDKSRRERVVFDPGSGGSDDTADNATGHSNWPTYVAFGVGGAGLVLGVIFTIAAVNQNSTLAGECTLPSGGCDPSFQSQIDALHRDQIVAGSGYAVAFVSSGVGAYLLLRSISPSSKTRAIETPVVKIVPRLGLGWFGVGGQF